MLLKWTPAYGRSGVTRKCVKQKRKCHDHERIELKGRDHVAMKQAVKSASTAATRTGKSRKRAKGAARKEA